MDKERGCQRCGHQEMGFDILAGNKVFFCFKCEGIFEWRGKDEPLAYVRDLYPEEAAGIREIEEA